mmetsp:Transcript_21447/g.33561  ORF Transcript_21447/g.33561 Transcript_21447/m.33561 type:complete len:219 (+) Transcript_21447:1034-1690(+)
MRHPEHLFLGGDGLHLLRVTSPAGPGVLGKGLHHLLLVIEERKVLVPLRNLQECILSNVADGGLGHSSSQARAQEAIVEGNINVVSERSPGSFVLPPGCGRVVVRHAGLGVTIFYLLVQASTLTPHSIHRPDGFPLVHELDTWEVSGRRNGNCCNGDDDLGVGGIRSLNSLGLATPLDENILVIGIRVLDELVEGLVGDGELGKLDFYLVGEHITVAL